jgi:hypothetical protein
MMSKARVSRGMNGAVRKVGKGWGLSLLDLNILKILLFGLVSSLVSSLVHFIG